MTDGRSRVIITGVRPEIDGGQYPIKRTVGEQVTVTANIFADGHDLLACQLLYRHAADADWTAAPMTDQGNDRWQATFAVTAVGCYRYTLRAWVDRYGTWARDLVRRAAAGQELSVDLHSGAALLAAAARRARGAAAAELRALAKRLQTPAASESERVELALDPRVAEWMARYGDRRPAVTYAPELTVVVDRERARFSTWYELFPRSCAAAPGRHGSFRDLVARLPYVAGMGFDVLYLPPIHPIGATCRKGRNNATACDPDDPGSPWAIGTAAGGHLAIHPELGSLDDFRALLVAAGQYGLEVALDLAFQCSPDHPWVREHPQWFRHRPDGSIQYAENPPKRYQDIYPLDFESADWQALWAALKAVVLFWIAAGVRIFRVDNPHTKPFRFWQWLIAEIKRESPEVIFLSEAFTRPQVMYHLAKLGFTQSYTYFTWRNTRHELTEYFTELTRTKVREYFRPHLWPNTPDILPEVLQHGGRPAFMARLVLAATLGASYGIYGPAFELCEHRAVAPGREEYLDAEKYEIKHWPIDRPDSLRDFIARVNRIRHEHPALHWDHNLNFHDVDNDSLIAYSKHTDDLTSVILVVVNLDPHHTRAGWVELDLGRLGLDPEQAFQVHDLLTDARYLWQGSRNYVELNPHVVPAHIFKIRRRVYSEHDFDYFA